jgi:chitin disaccharide deacetylase
MAEEQGQDDLVMLHVDDVGMCHGANLAFAELGRIGRCDCGSVMVPCPWFLEAAEMAARDPRLDLGVHLTLTAEKRFYRWRPLTGVSRAAGLTDSDGFFWRSVADLRRQAHPAAVESELRAQIDAARAAGIDVTHLDDHMGAVFAPEFVEIYVRLGLEYDLPILFPRSMTAYGPIHNLPGAPDEGLHARLAARLEGEGERLADRVLETPWSAEASLEARYCELFAAAAGGFTVIALHPNAPGEIEAIEPDTASIRTEEYAMLRSALGGALIDAMPGRRTGMRALRDQRRKTRSQEGAKRATVQ